MTRPYASDARSTVVERPPGRLGKRGAWVEQSGAVCLARRTVRDDRRRQPPSRSVGVPSTSAQGLEGGAAK